MPKRAVKPPSETNSRAARSGLQGGLVSAVILLINLLITPDLTPEQTLIISPFVLLVVSYFQNALEEASGVSVLGKRPAAPDADVLTAEEIALIRQALPAPRQP